MPQAKKQKKVNTTQKEKLTIENSSFRPDQKIEVQGIDFLTADMTFDAYMESLEGFSMPLRYKWIDKYDEPVENPTKEDVENKGLRQVFDPHATYNPRNVVKSLNFRAKDKQELDFEFQRFQQIIEGKRRMLEIHNREVEEGRTVSLETLQAEYSVERTEVVE